MTRFSYLSGHSGCKIILCENDNEIKYVRKISSDIAYNERLQKQVYKQEMYKSKFFKVPKVIKKGFTEDNLYYFEMEYIQGITLAEYIKKIEINRLNVLVKKITEELLSDFDNTQKTDVLVFHKKISELKIKIEIYNNHTFDLALNILNNHDWSKFYVNNCHGDFTLENIIVKNDELYLIDFLDSFYDSKLLDMGSILQDIQAMWSYRKSKSINVNTMIRLVVFKDLFVDEIKEIMKDDFIEIYYALLLKLVRIIQYTKDELTLNFVEGKINEVLKIIRKCDLR